MENKPQTLQLPFLQKRQEARDTYTFYFKREKGFQFFPGQYIRMILPIQHPDQRGSSRFFSISSSPLDTSVIGITTRIIQSSFKRALFSLKDNSLVTFFGPMGQFIFNERDTTPCIFLAGGIGITPFHSMICYAAAKNVITPITLFVSFSKVEEMIFYKELISLTQAHSSIQVVYTITNPEESAIKWNGETGRISKDLIQKYVLDTQNASYWIAGPPAMVKTMEELVSELGISHEKVKKEQFVGY